MSDKMMATESINILSRCACEVYIFTLDGTSTLKPGNWSFRLDTSPQKFATEMQERWSNMAWHVSIAKTTDGQSLWETLRSWKEDGMAWRHFQKELYKEKPNVDGTWAFIAAWGYVTDEVRARRPRFAPGGTEKPM